MPLPVTESEFVQPAPQTAANLAEPIKSNCPNCGAEVMSGAGFCGNCGFDLRTQVDVEPVNLPAPPTIPMVEHAASSTPAATQLQTPSVYLLHVQTDTKIEIPPGKLLVHLGKPNNLIAPDIDLSGLPDSDIVSRVHGDIRNEEDAYYFEDTGSSNGTYINNVPLPPGNRHRLKVGDRISLGKGDRVSFIFQVGS